MNLADSLTKGEIHLHLTDDTTIGDPALLSSYEALMSDDEQARRDRFRFERHRHQFLVSRALLRTTLSHYRPSVSPGTWRFGTNAHGRPSIAGGTDGLDFNLTHTEGRIVLAVSLMSMVGVDIEALDRTDDMIELARQFFAPAELADILALPQDRQRRRFFDLWTLKEAYVKARGLGLSIPLTAFAIGFPAERKLSIAFQPPLPNSGGSWKLWTIDAGDRHALALAVPHAGPTVIRMFEHRPLERITEIACDIAATS